MVMKVVKKMQDQHKNNKKYKKSIFSKFSRIRNEIRSYTPQPNNRSRPKQFFMKKQP